MLSAKPDAAIRSKRGVFGASRESQPDRRFGQDRTQPVDPAAALSPQKRRITLAVVKILSIQSGFRNRQPSNIMTASLSVGDPAPWFSVATGSSRVGTVSFDELGGRYIVLFFFGAAARAHVSEALAEFAGRSDLFDDKRAVFIGIDSDPNEFSQHSVHQNRPGHFFILDANGAVAKLYGVDASDTPARPAAGRPVAFIVSPALQIIEVLTLDQPTAFAERIISSLNERLKNSVQHQNAPVLVVPKVFDQAFCRQLVDLYESAGGREIGAVESNGTVVERFDPKFRKRLDWYISDEPALQRSKEFLAGRLLPIVYRAFQFRVTRIERYLVGCYDAHTGGYFRPHRDNMAPPVAHRRFAVTINLNDDYDGGHLHFPEFGYQAYRTAPGDAIVFSCSLLHEVMPITRARRYAFLSFFYDEQAQQLRDEYVRKMAQPRPAVKAG